MHKFDLVREILEGFPEEVMLALRAEGRVDVNLVENSLGRGNKCKGSVTEDSMTCMML